MYCWPTKGNSYSGKDLPRAQYKDVYDCSGLVTASLFSATGIDLRSTFNAQKLADEADLVNLKEVKRGDLVFYGADSGNISHVMVYMGAEGKNGPVYGSSGGNSKTVSPEVAMRMDARVKTHNTINYRPDFVCCGRMRIDNAKVRG